MKTGKAVLTIFACAIVIASCSKKEEEPTPTPDPGAQKCFDTWDYTDQLPNLDFEEWASPLSSGGKYEEPCGGVWATGNGGTALENKVTTSKTMVAQNGTYAAEMQTVLALGLISGGSIYAGEFVLNLVDPSKSAKQGVPFTAKPVSFKGFFKYAPVNGDSSNVIVLLTKYNASSKMRDTVGYGYLPGYTEVSSFEEFDIPIDYASYSAGSEVPDSVNINFTSSKGAEFFKGEVGSTFVVDNCKFAY